MLQKKLTPDIEINRVFVFDFDFVCRIDLIPFDRHLLYRIYNMGLVSLLDIYRSRIEYRYPIDLISSMVSM